MRPGSAFLSNSDQSDAPSTSPAQPHSAWQSPVPYLFGGLAAMLGLIALALLILACSYWKLNSFLSESQSDDPASNDRDTKPAAQSGPPAILHQLFAVIMAGEQKPTFLATPSCSRSGSFDCVKGEEKAVQISTDGRNVAPALSRSEASDEESGQVQ
ncbi:protein GLUTAMINE DUMPER 2-like protein [Carex littledalei]|uniref:Protein GLUTAMINE DUMPER 2-like protein n=1 Tax=Carex littledalei TaxID=544730 RepID=A0A833QMS5_9POAL|nr:protein GLUTAMINE DUMPER 2-like protein [Carex littledalei]